MIDNEIHEKVTKARLRLLFKSYWLAILSYYLKMKPNPDMPIPTMRTDSLVIEYHPEFVRQNDIEAITTVVVHETLHCALQHIFRGKNRHPIISLYAADYATNWVLKDSGFPMYEGMLYSPKYHGWSFEEIYKDLMERFEKIMQEGQTKERKKKPGGQESSGEGNEQQTTDEMQVPKLKKSSSPEVDPDELLRKLRDGIREVFDEHMKPGSSELKKQKGQEEALKKVKQLKQEWKTRICGLKQRGDLPGSLVRIVEDFLHPKVPWKALLFQFIEKVVKMDYSWYPPNRKHLYRGAYLPRMNPDDYIEIAIGLDTSGSVSYEKLREFVSEVRGITQAFKNCKIHLFPNDAEVFDYIEIESFNGDVDWESIKKRIGGGGGTDFRPVFEEIENRGLDFKIKALIYITDGWGIYPREEPPYPVLWVIKGKYPRDKIPIGEVIYLDDF